MQEIDRRKQREELCTLVQSCYERIATGEVNDSIRLLFAQESPRTLGKLDLFAISAIKKQKEGMEIAFYDRMEALARLYEMSQSGSGEDLIRALGEGAKALGSD